jgi:hypothetical protein
VRSGYKARYLGAIERQSVDSCLFRLALYSISSEESESIELACELTIVEPAAEPAGEPRLTIVELELSSDSTVDLRIH